MSSEILLSVVIPAYNEEAVIERTLTRLLRYFRHKPYRAEILVVDDGSQDQTAVRITALAQRHRMITLLRNRQNRGKGYSVRRGARRALGAYVLMFDADSSAPITEWEKLRRWCDRGYEVAIGSRAIQGHQIHVCPPWYRISGGIIFNRIVQCLLLPGLYDTQCGFKCFARPTAQRLFRAQRLPGFAFDVELLYLARRHGYQIKEVGVRWNYGRKTSVHFVRDGLRMLRDILRIRWYTFRGSYRVPHAKEGAHG